MNWNLLFFINSIALGVGLAMDAFSVSLANGLNEPGMKKNRMSLIAGVFAGFQILMPLIGWFCVYSIMYLFSAFQKFIPWIALALLAYIGGKMIIDGVKGGDEEEAAGGVTLGALIIQGIATSIDALSVGFTISDYSLIMAIVCALIIGVVTFTICMTGLYLGKKFGTKLAGKAQILGGVILVIIGLEIFIKGVIL